jgi:hypothetical protein
VLSSDAISLTQLHYLVVADATHALSSDAIIFFAFGSVTLSETYASVTLSEAIATVVAGDS